MFYKNFHFIFILILLTNCTTNNLINNKPDLILKNNFTNKGFTIIYNTNLYNKKIVSKKIDERSLVIFQKNLKKNTLVKITNLLNDKSLIAKVGAKSNYPSFNNSVISERIAKELDINSSEPYVEILSISKNSLFVAKKAKTFDEEREVANKVPVNSINIDDLNKIENINNKIVKSKFSYVVKVADFYFNETALKMLERIIVETNVKNPKLKKISTKKYRVYLGPFDNINSLKKSYNDINILGFDNIEIIKND
jgi:hypothetical protein